ncbi:MAG TPA: hypothetical protein VLH40_10510 [Atribacteraceae bacterium]|nr:hypothetical protein [Atribacteraceae bacterium]
MFWNILGIILLISFLYPILQRKILEQERLRLIHGIERKRRTRVIIMIHRQEAMSFFGFPLVRYITIEDSENLLRAIRLTPDDVPIDLILHTPGGLVLASEQIAHALKKHPSRVTVFVPHYAMSGGTLIALAADEIVLDSFAVLGPVDPQLRTAHFQYPAVSIVQALQQPNPHRDDELLILGDIAGKAIEQVKHTVEDLVQDTVSREQIPEVVKHLSEGCWTHDFPIFYEKLKEIGLPVKEGLPEDICELMKLYPQPPQTSPSVEYIPGPYRPFRKNPKKK